METAEVMDLATGWRESAARMSDADLLARAARALKPAQAAKAAPGDGG